MDDKTENKRNDKKTQNSVDQQKINFVECHSRKRYDLKDNINTSILNIICYM